MSTLNLSNIASPQNTKKDHGSILNEYKSILQNSLGETKKMKEELEFEKKKTEIINRGLNNSSLTHMSAQSSLLFPSPSNSQNPLDFEPQTQAQSSFSQSHTYSELQANSNTEKYQPQSQSFYERQTYYNAPSYTSSYSSPYSNKRSLSESDLLPKSNVNAFSQPQNVFQSSQSQTPPFKTTFSKTFQKAGQENFENYKNFENKLERSYSPGNSYLPDSNHHYETGHRIENFIESPVDKLQTNRLLTDTSKRLVELSSTSQHLLHQLINDSVLHQMKELEKEESTRLELEQQEALLRKIEEYQNKSLYKSPNRSSQTSLYGTSYKPELSQTQSKTHTQTHAQAQTQSQGINAANTNQHRSYFSPVESPASLQSRHFSTGNDISQRLNTTSTPPFSRSSKNYYALNEELVRSGSKNSDSKFSSLRSSPQSSGSNLTSTSRVSKISKSSHSSRSNTNKFPLKSESSKTKSLNTKTNTNRSFQDWRNTSLNPNQEDTTFFQESSQTQIFNDTQGYDYDSELYPNLNQTQMQNQTFDSNRLESHEYRKPISRTNSQIIKSNSNIGNYTLNNQNSKQQEDLHSSQSSQSYTQSPSPLKEDQYDNEDEEDEFSWINEDGTLNQEKYNNFLTTIGNQSAFHDIFGLGVIGQPSSRNITSDQPNREVFHEMSSRLEGTFHPISEQMSAIHVFPKIPITHKEELSQTLKQSRNLPKDKKVLDEKQWYSSLDKLPMHGETQRKIEENRRKLFQAVLRERRIREKERRQLHQSLNKSWKP